MKLCSILLLFFFTLLCVPGLRAAQVVETDVCVYGGAAGGVTAAVAAARQGKRWRCWSLTGIWPKPR